jgi:hypothetical protein
MLATLFFIFLVCIPLSIIGLILLGALASSIFEYDDGLAALFGIGAIMSGIGIWVSIIGAKVTGIVWLILFIIDYAQAA